MSETERRSGSPLDSDRGTTSISSGSVEQIVNRALGELEGIRVDKVSSDISQYEVALDYEAKLEYGGDLPDLISRLRSGVREQVEMMTGLRVTDQNVIVTDILFPDSEEEQGEDQDRPQVR